MICEMALDEDAYSRSLQTVLQLAKDRLDFYLERLRLFQLGIIRTYLWISAFIITTQVGLLRAGPPPGGASIYLALTSIVVSGIVFVLAVDMLRGRGADRSSVEQPKEMADLAYRYSGGELPHQTFLVAVIKGLDENLSRLREKNRKSVRKLRAISLSLTISGLVGLGAWIVEIFLYG